MVGLTVGAGLSVGESEGAYVTLGEGVLEGAADGAGLGIPIAAEAELSAEANHRVGRDLIPIHTARRAQ